VVINTNDSGAGSLRQAIYDALPGDTITFDLSLAGQTIPLISQIDIDTGLTIDGSGLNPGIEISGNLGTRIFYITSKNDTVTLQSLLLRDGRDGSGSGGGAIFNDGNLTVSNSTLINNATTGHGGAIYSRFSLNINNSTFVSNNAASGGAIYIAGGIFLTPNSTNTIANSTFVSNQANAANGLGGGVFNYGSGNNYPGEPINILVNNTFSENGAYSGGGLYSWGNLSFRNNILANSTSGGDCVSYSFGGMVAGSHNLIEDGNPCSSDPFLRGDPLLGPLSDNGGPTQTMALLPGSPAIDAGTVTCVPADQRGVTRPQGAACEIGAYEYEYQSLIYYVKWDAGGANNGSSWLDAYTDLQSALAAAFSGDEIWVAAGTYKPTAGTDRTISFTLKNGVAMYGGFAGTEASRTQRDYETNVTVLSGDIGVVGENSDNSYHVMVGSNTNEYAKLDGFTVTAGNADGSPSPNDRGGGMYNDQGNPSLAAVIFSGNYAILGGGMYNGGGDSYQQGNRPVLKNVIFRDNSAIEGGGLRNENYSSASLLNVIFSDNTAIRSGGGMENFNYSNPIMTNVTFNSNTSGAGGGMMNWSNSSPILMNVTFHANAATDWGGAIYNDNGSNPWLMYVTFSGNNASQGGGLYNADGSNPSITNSILYGNPGGEIFDASGTRTVTYSIVQGGYPGTGNLDADPLLGPLQDNGDFTQTMALGAGSPAIDTGDNWNCPATDQRGMTRPQGAACDIGAFEAVVIPTPTPTDIPTFTPTSTITNTPTFTPTLTNTPSPTLTPTVTPPYSYNPLYLSFTSNQTIGSVASADEDILEFDGRGWMLFFDGSDVGMGTSDLFSFSILDADTILMSFNSAITVNGISATPQDILRFDATSLGDVTSGTFSLYFDGSDVGFNTSAESIDALALLPDGHLLISTTGNPSVPGLTTGRDEDVLSFTPVSLGAVTSGIWAMYFDGSEVGLGESSGEDIDALDVVEGNIYISTAGNFSANGVLGADEDVFICAATSIGNVTVCNYSPSLYFDGSTWGLTANNVDAFNFLPSPYVKPPNPTITLVP
jgi:hypothetical protein